MRRSWQARLRRAGAGIVIGGYLALIGFFAFQQVVGDVNRSPFAYFWTWNMFPNFRCLSSRSEAVGRTVGGSYVSLLPGPRQRFRWGARGNLTRADYDRTSSEHVIQDVLQRTRADHAADRIAHVYLIEKYWPVRFNSPERLYETLYQPVEKGGQAPQDPVFFEAILGLGGASPRFSTGCYGEPRPSRKYWRVVGEFDVSETGLISTGTGT